MINYTLLEFDELNSTSDLLKENSAYFPHMTWIKANYQTLGRGQFDRMWSSDKSKNILCSILLKDIAIDKANQIKSWVIDSVELFLQTLGIQTTFKEPNDLYVNGEKICGILIETKSKNLCFESVIIGIGINVNQDDFNQLNATSIKKVLGNEQDLKQLFHYFMTFMLETYEGYEL